MKIPEFQRQVKETGLPNARQTMRVDASNFLGGTEAAMLNGAVNITDMASKQAIALQLHHEQEADKTRATDFITQFETRKQDALFGQSGAFNVKGGDVFNQPNKRPLTENVLDDLTHFASSLAEQAGNDNQKQLLNDYVQKSLLSTRGQLLQHEGEQYRVYQKGVGLAAIDTNQKAISNNYNNPEAVQQSIDAIKTASIGLGKLDGQPEEFGAAQAQKHVSGALSQAIEASLAQGDHASATKLLKQFSPDMDTNDMLKAYQTITKEQDARLSYGIAQSVMSQVYPKMQTNDADRAFNIAINAESGGNHFVPGTDKPTTSSKGAIGIAQVMPATGPEAAKLAGLDWDEARFKNDPEYNAALGKAYFNKQLTSFNGDISKAYAAYNAGPGAMQDAQDKADKEGGNWLSYLPQETQAYVAKNKAAYDAGSGQYKKPTLAETIAAADATIGPNASPELRKKVRDEVQTQFDLQDKAIKQRGDEAVAEAYRQLQQNGGKFSALPVALRTAIDTYAPDKVDTVMNFGKKLSEGEPVATDWGLYAKLKTDAGLLKNTNLMAFRDKLNDTEFKQLINEQQSQANGESTSTRDSKDILKNFMIEAGIDPSPKDDDKEGAAKVGKIWAAFDSRVIDAEQDKGRKLNPEELKKVAAQMFVTVGINGFLKNSEKPAVLVDWKKDKVTVPDEDRAQIITALRAATPGRAVTEDDIFNIYAKHKGLY